MQKLDFAKMGCIYRLGADGVTIETEIGRAIPPVFIHRIANDGYGGLMPHIHRLHRAVKREHTFLCTGNDTVFTMATIEVLPQKDPPILALGEWHCAVYNGAKRYVFVEADRIAVQHLPGGTRWRVYFHELPTLCFVLEVSLRGEHGIVATLQAEGEVDKQSLTAELTLRPGTIGARTFTAAYFPEDSETFLPLLSPPEIAESENGAYVQWRFDGNCAQVPETAYYGVWGYNALMAAQGEGTMTVTVPVVAGPIAVISGVHAHVAETADVALLCHDWHEAIKVQAEEAIFWRSLLERSELHTPSPIFAGGFSHAVLNLEYDHFDHAWFEGCHWWNCYWTNNYQISAAISLGQYDRARKALAFFGSREHGYDPINSDGSVFEIRRRPDGSPFLAYDGIPYYLWQLWQYVQQTGDLSIVEEVAAHVDANCQDLIAMCDPDDDGLFNWHFGSNMLLYQADHLGLPGTGTSPTIIIACAFAKFAELLEQCGKTNLAAFYRKRSQRAYEALMPLWDVGRGCYPAGVDLSGHPTYAHYYTDLVYPMLYGKDAPVRKILLLLHLKDSLCHRSETTGMLQMRVGKLKPDLFGNNNVMPVQMAEAARALLAAGDRRGGGELLDSLTLAYSLYTESPGSAPERLNDYGKAEANFIFGNPSGALPYAVVDGLCGVAIEDWGHTLRLAPAFPEDWDSACIRLPYAAVYYTHLPGQYRIRIQLPQDHGIDTLRFSLCVTGLTEAQLWMEGKECPCHFTPALESVRVEAEAAVCAREMELILCYTARPKTPREPLYVRVGERISCEIEGETVLENQPTVFDRAGLYHLLYSDGCCLRDQPVCVLPNFEIRQARIADGKLQLHGQAWGDTVSVQVWLNNQELTGVAVTDPQGGFVWEHSVATSSYPACTLTYIGENGQTVWMDIAVEGEFPGGHPLPLEAYVNADAINATNRWRGGSAFEVPLLPADADPRVYKTHGVTYRLLPKEPTGLPRMCLLEKGRSQVETGQIDPGCYPAQVRIPIHDHVHALALLYAGEVEPRLTGEVLGTICLRYADGERCIPLQSGRNMGSLFSNYAAEVAQVPLLGESFVHDSVNHACLGVDPDRLLEELEITLDREDAQLALLAATVF
ncbi:MAG: hypothetical protein J6K98_01000 [Clostridia bacterium]|nr:hypothetical protein [Clostridia bacterium]